MWRRFSTLHKHNLKEFPFKPNKTSYNITYALVFLCCVCVDFVVVVTPNTQTDHVFDALLQVFKEGWVVRIQTLKRLNHDTKICVKVLISFLLDLSQQ